MKPKTEFESRIEYRLIRLRSQKKPVYEASIFWNGKLFETIKATKELCTAELKQQANCK